jgi:hypothetical protein
VAVWGVVSNVAPVATLFASMVSVTLAVSP